MLFFFAARPEGFAAKKALSCLRGGGFGWGDQEVSGVLINYCSVVPTFPPTRPEGVANKRALLCRRGGGLAEV